MSLHKGVLLSLIFWLPLLHIWYRMMKLPFICKYPTWRTSSLYVFPLMCLQELFSNPILHRATAKALSVDLDVKFLSCLKKPVMTKRASLGASFVSGVNGKSYGKSPMPSSVNRTSHSQPSPIPAVPAAPREPIKEAVVVLAEGILILIPFSHAREACVRTSSTVFSSTRS